MPIYEYHCNACQHNFDHLQKVSDQPFKTCPKCGKPNLEKLVSAPGFRLDGKGWYETDFKESNRKNIAEKESNKTVPAECKTCDNSSKCSA